VLVNAGPTHESIDPVRFIGNHSSGKMGVAIAVAASACGADVHLIAGPGVVVPPGLPLQVTWVTTADEMAAACQGSFPGCDVAVLAAAVADFTPVEKHDTKVKRGTGEMIIRLRPTSDIAAGLGSTKKSGQIICGFALETDNEIDNAVGKLRRKNLDMIVLNSLRDEGAGFGVDTNRVTIIDSNNKIDKFELKPKDEVALDILWKIVSLRERKL
jgi:phosphopantothenoylcysteine decarboxylase/phosphopantothenate--cysteine ligase